MHQSFKLLWATYKKRWFIGLVLVLVLDVIDNWIDIGPFPYYTEYFGSYLLITALALIILSRTSTELHDATILTLLTPFLVLFLPDWLHPLFHIGDPEYPWGSPSACFLVNHTWLFYTAGVIAAIFFLSHIWHIAKLRIYTSPEETMPFPKGTLKLHFRWTARSIFRRPDHGDTLLHLRLAIKDTLTRYDGSSTPDDIQTYILPVMTETSKSHHLSQLTLFITGVTVQERPSSSSIGDIIIGA